MHRDNELRRNIQTLSSGWVFLGGGRGGDWEAHVTYNIMNGKYVSKATQNIQYIFLQRTDNE